MNFYEDEEFEQKIEQITDQFGYLLLDIIFMSFQKINTENQILKEFLDARLQVHKEKAF
jgi:cupin superfamily acireductone dioxygenase involved in methionine salvage